MEQTGFRPVTGQEKRLIVQNFAHFQQFSRPGAKGSTFARIPEVPRCEAACALCQRKDFIEHRHKLNLFREAPSKHHDSTGSIGSASQPAAYETCSPHKTDDVCDGPTEDTRYHSLVKHDGVYYLQSPEAVHVLLSVDRYAERWPLVPREELHASSVQHPHHPE